MSLDMLNAVVAGYSNALLDQQLLAVQSGYWSAYYSNSKHAKPVQTVCANMIRAHQKQAPGSKPRPDIDVEAFLEQDAKFKEALAKRGVENNG